jgi:hypothetical protein
MQIQFGSIRSVASAIPAYTSAPATSRESVNHLIEHPSEGSCSTGPRPVSATCFIAAKRSRWAFGIGVVQEASSLPRYCNSVLALRLGGFFRA